MSCSLPFLLAPVVAPVVPQGIHAPDSATNLGPRIVELVGQPTVLAESIGYDENTREVVIVGSTETLSNPGLVTVWTYREGVGLQIFFPSLPPHQPGHVARGYEVSRNGEWIGAQVHFDLNTFAPAGCAVWHRSDLTSFTEIGSIACGANVLQPDYPIGISDTGRVVGGIHGVPWTWDLANGLQSLDCDLPGLPPTPCFACSVHDVSRDGETLVGGVSSGPDTYPVQWNSGAIQALAPINGSPAESVLSLSGDGARSVSFNSVEGQSALRTQGVIEATTNVILGWAVTDSGWCTHQDYVWHPSLPSSERFVDWVFAHTGMQLPDQLFPWIYDVVEADGALHFVYGQPGAGLWYVRIPLHAL